MRAKLVSILVLGTVLLAACGQQTGSGAPKQGQTLTVAIGADPDTLDPMRQTTTTIQNIVQMMVETLVRVDDTGKDQPLLATSWTQAPDGMSWTFTLRQNVRFSDGTRFDAQAVKASLDRDLDPANTCPLCGLMRQVQSVKALDDGHVQLALKEPLAADIVLGLLSEVTFGIVSSRSIQKGSPAYSDQEQPVGTGPYVFEQRVKGDHVTLERNDHYWGTKPAYREQVIKIVPDAATREALVRSGEAQVILLPPTSDLPTMQSDSSLKVMLAPDDRTIFIAINTVDKNQPLLQKPEVREALNYAVNKDAIVKSTLFGAAVPMTAPMASSLFGYCNLGEYAYDPGKARQLLQAAGASGMTARLVSPTGRYIQDFQAAQNVANDLRAVGVNVQGPQTMDWPTYLATEVTVPPARATQDLGLLGWAPGYLDASQQMVQFDPTQVPPTGLNNSYYGSPAVAALINKAAVEKDRNARAQEYCQAEKQIWSDAPWIFLYVQRFPIVYSSKVTGVGSIPNESFNTVYAQPA